MIRGWLVPFASAACLLAAQPATAAPAVRAEPAPTVTPADIRFRHDVLRRGSAREAGLLADRVAALPGIAASYLVPTADHPDRPAYAGATVLAAHHGIVVQRFAVGDAVRYAAAGSSVVELPPGQRIPARTDTRWDLASISKLFTTIVLLQQVGAGRVVLDAPVARYVPEFAAGGSSPRRWSGRRW
jgi:CubicO group peptidase (beta-lactamase class C family)